MSSKLEEPKNMYLAHRAIAMPKDTNPNGDMFGGWLVSQMDLAAGNTASQRAQGRVVTVAIDNINFLLPVCIGDEVSCYCDITRIGTTSMTLKVEVWVRRRLTDHREKVTQGTFTFVAIDEKRKPRPIPPENS